MESISLRGLGVALITPFDKEKKVDFESLSKVIEHILDGGADYLVVLGTTGETPTLTPNEKEAIRRFVVGEVDSRVPLVLGLGGNSTQSVVEELKSIDLSGYSAILSVTPFYNKPSQRGMYQHFSEIAKTSPLPVVLYNVPGRTGVNLDADTTLALAHEFKNIIGIKEASGNFKQIEKIICGRPEGFYVVSGDDALTYPLLSLGAEGVISVVGNAFPMEFGNMVRLCLDGQFREALPVHYRFSKLYDELFVEGNPAGVKCLLHDMGLIHNELRLPLVPTGLETSTEIKHLLKQLTK